MRILKPLALFSSVLLRATNRGGYAARWSTVPAPFLSKLQKGEMGTAYSFKIKSRFLSSLVEASMDFEMDQPCDEGKVTEKANSLHLALSQLAGDFDRDSNLSLGRFNRMRYAPVISTGSLKLDQALGIGGLPKGRVVEIYGREASGKTTLALHIVKEAQKLGGYCAYVDVENAMDPSLAEAMGINIENLLIAHPSSAENSLSIVNTLVNSGSVDVVVVDSVAALVPQCEIDGVIDLSSEEVQSRLMTQALRKIHHSLSRSQTLIIFVNQVRTSISSSQCFGQINEVTCGGNSLRFYAAIRMRITRSGLLYNKDKITGISISVQIIKNKLAAAMKKATLDIGFGRGFCHEAEILDLASEHGIVQREGNGYWIKGDFLNDQQEAREYLVQNSDVQNELFNLLREQLFGIAV